MRNARLLLAVTLAAMTASCGTTAPSCAYAVTPTAAAFPATGGNLTFSVTTGDSCTWSVSADASWFAVVFNGPSATRIGSGTVQVVTGPNTGAARTGTLSIARLNVSIAQPAGAQTYSLSGVVKEAWIDTGLPGASVAILTGPSGGFATTDGQGRYLMPNLLPGTYTVRMSKPAPFQASSYGPITVAGDTTLDGAVTITVAFPVTAADLQGHWVAQGPYPNEPAYILLIQNGSRLEGWYKDRRNYSTSMSGTYTGHAIAIDVGVAGLRIEGRVEDARCIRAFIKDEALGGNFPVTISRGGACPS